MRAEISQDSVSRVERGQIDALQVRTVRAVMRVLEMDLRLEGWWRGGDLDRLADEGHAALVARIASVLASAGWGAAGLLVFLSPTLPGRRGRGPVAARRIRRPTDAPEA